MEEPGYYLFVYGTLLQSENEFGAYLAANSTFYGKGKFRGHLYDLGDYPGVLAAPNGGGFVYGGIYHLTSPDAVLPVLDDYEGFGSGYALPNLFVRELLQIETDNNQPVNCWIYLYNLPVESFQKIASGDYLEHLRLKSTNR